MSWQQNREYALKEFHALLVWIAIAAIGGLTATGAAAIQLLALPTPPDVSLGGTWWFATAGGMAFLARLSLALAAAFVGAEKRMTPEAPWLRAIGAVCGLTAAITLCVGVLSTVRALTSILP